MEIYIDRSWRKALAIEIDNPVVGVAQTARLNFDVDYLNDYLLDAAGDLSVLVPTEPIPLSRAQWPSFLVDMIPQGAGRKRALDQLGIMTADGSHNDWALLKGAAANPPGNLRVAQAAQNVLHQYDDHPGFRYEEVVERNEYFLDYAQSHGASVAGSTGAQGEAPKFLLTKDILGQWHADGALPDHLAESHYLVKFPRGKKTEDMLILESEAKYHKFARWFGVETHGEVTHDQGILFVPRFDRKINGDRTVERYGLESLYSALNIVEPGRAVTIDSMLEAINEYGSESADLIEFVKRDMLNLALKNTDNHGRNHALIKRGGEIRLSPLFDFAPMYLDAAGIARVSRWQHEKDNGNRVDWSEVVRILMGYGIDSRDLESEFEECLEKLTVTPEKLTELDVDPGIVDRVSQSAEMVAAGLDKALWGLKA